MNLAGMLQDSDVTGVFGGTFDADQASGWWTAATGLWTRGRRVGVVLYAYVASEDDGELVVLGGSLDGVEVDDEHAAHPVLLAALNAANADPAATWRVAEGEGGSRLVCESWLPAELVTGQWVKATLEQLLRRVRDEVAVLTALATSPVAELDAALVTELAESLTEPAGTTDPSTPPEARVPIGQSLRGYVAVVAAFAVLFGLAAWLSLSQPQETGTGPGSPAHATADAPAVVAEAVATVQNPDWVHPYPLPPPPPYAAAYIPPNTAAGHPDALWVAYPRGAGPATRDGVAVDAKSAEVVYDYQLLQGTGALPHLTYGSPSFATWCLVGLLLLGCLCAIGIWSRRVLTLRQACLTGGFWARAAATVERLAWSAGWLYVVSVVAAHVRVALLAGAPTLVLLTIVVAISLVVSWLYAGVGLLRRRDLA